MTMVKMWIERDGTTVMSIRGDVSEDEDLARLNGVLIAEFRSRFPNESLFDTYKIGWSEVTGET